MSTYDIIKHLHSGFRFVVMLLVLLAILQSLTGWLGKKPYTDGNRKLNLFAMISAHIQLLLGLALYFLSPYVQFTSAAMKSFETRYWTSEHITMMIFAIVLITIGHSRAKKLVLPEAKHRAITIFYTLALVLVAVAIVLSKRGFFQVTA
ncbi:cytochrome B [Mucilaginibacter koreensis]